MQNRLLLHKRYLGVFFMDELTMMGIFSPVSFLFGEDFGINSTKILRFWTYFPCRNVNMNWHRRARWWAVFTRRLIRLARSLIISRSIIIWWRMAKVYGAPPLRVAYRNLFLIRLVPLSRGVAHPRRMRPLDRWSIINALLTSRRRQPLMTNWNKVVLPPRFPWIVQRPNKLRKNRDSLPLND